MRMRRSCAPLALLACSVLLPVFCVNFLLVLFGDNAQSKKTLEVESAFAKRSSDQDYRQKIRAVDQGYIPNFTPEYLYPKFKFSGYYPIGSLQLAKTYYCNEGYGLIRFQTDRFGLRNNDDSWNDIDSSDYVLLLGDSFVQGACVEDQYTISTILEKTLSKPVFNLGVNGNGPYEYMATLKNFVKPTLAYLKNASYVVIVFYDNDMIQQNPVKLDLLHQSLPLVEFDSERKIRLSQDYIAFYSNMIDNDIDFDLRPEALKSVIDDNHGKSLETLAALKTSLYKQSKWYRIITLASIRSRLVDLFSGNSKIGLSIRENHKASLEAISLLSSICSDGCIPIVAYVPNSPLLKYNPNSSDFFKSLAEASLDNEILFFDGSKAIDPLNMTNYAPQGFHLSELGYKKFASALSYFIKGQDDIVSQ